MTRYVFSDGTITTENGIYRSVLKEKDKHKQSVILLITSKSQNQNARGDAELETHDLSTKNTEFETSHTIVEADKDSSANHTESK